MKANNLLRLPKATSYNWLSKYIKSLEGRYIPVLNEHLARDYKDERIVVIKFWEDYYMDSIKYPTHLEFLKLISKIYSVQLITKTVLNSVNQRVNTVEIVGYRKDALFAARHLHQYLLGWDVSYRYEVKEAQKANKKRRTKNPGVPNASARTIANRRTAILELRVINWFAMLPYWEPLHDRKTDISEWVLINKSLDLTAHVNRAITIRLKLARVPDTQWKTRRIINPWQH